MMLGLFKRKTGGGAAESIQVTNPFIGFAEDATDNFQALLEPFIKGNVITFGRLDTSANEAVISINSPRIKEALISFFNQVLDEVTIDDDGNNITIRSYDLRILTQRKESIQDYYEQIKAAYLQKIRNALSTERVDSELDCYLRDLGLERLMFIDSLLIKDKIKSRSSVSITKTIQGAVEEHEEKMAHYAEKRRTQKEYKECLSTLHTTLQKFLADFITADLLNIADITDDGIIIHSNLNPLLITALNSLMHNQKIQYEKLNGNCTKIKPTQENIKRINTIIDSELADRSQPPVYVTFIEATFKNFFGQSLKMIDDERIRLEQQPDVNEKSKAEIEALNQREQEIELVFTQFQTTRSEKAFEKGALTTVFDRNAFDVRECLITFNHLCRTDILAWAVQNAFDATPSKSCRTACAERVHSGIFNQLTYGADCGHSRQKVLLLGG